MTTTAFETLEIEVSGHLAIVRIAREAARNALSTRVIAELANVVGELEISEEIRVVIITGKGSAFVAGADIAEMRDMSPGQARAFSEMGGAVGHAIETSEKAYIAAVNGFALGGGCELALACDFIYASETAKLGQPEVSLGVIPGFGGTQRLARRVGVAKAKELCMTGDIIDAAEALRIRLVDKVVPAADLMATVTALAGRIAANGPLAVAECKRLIQEGQSVPLDAALALEQRSFGLCFATADQREGMAAFLDKPKRKPAFTGK